MADEEKLFTDAERDLLWSALETYLEDTGWSAILEKEQGVPFDTAVVKSTWMKLAHFDSHGPDGVVFSQKEQKLLWALLSFYNGDLECSKIKNCPEPKACREEDCLAYHDIVQAIFRKLPVPALQQQWVIELEELIDRVRGTIIWDPTKTHEENSREYKARSIDHERERKEILDTLKRMWEAES